MRNIAIFTLLFMALAACSTRKEYKAEDYQLMQTEYEQKKAEINKVKGAFYKENKEALMNLAASIRILSDSATVFEDAPEDSTYYKDDVAMNAINFSYYPGVGYTTSNTNDKDVPEAKVIFINRIAGESSQLLFHNPMKELCSCYDTKLDVECIKLKEENLKLILGLKYAFVIDKLLEIQPVLKGDQFEGGLYLGKIVCYDLASDEPLLSFLVTATNSEQIEVNTTYGQSAQRVLEQDLSKNIKEAIMDSCKKHFRFI